MVCNPTVKIQLLQRDGNGCGSKVDTVYRFLILFHRNEGVDHQHRKSLPGTVYHENCAVFTFWRFLAGCSRSAKIESSKKLMYLLAIWESAFKYRFSADTGNRDHFFKTSRLP